MGNMEVSVGNILSVVLLVSMVQGASPEAPASAPAAPKKMEVAMPDAAILGTLWDSAKSAKACAEANSAQVLGEAQAAVRGGLRSVTQATADPAIWEEGTIAKLTSGTQLETKGGKECDGGGVDGKEMVAVSVVSGKHAGKSGCLYRRHVKDVAP